MATTGRIRRGAGGGIELQLGPITRSPSLPIELIASSAERQSFDAVELMNQMARSALGHDAPETPRHEAEKITFSQVNPTKRLVLTNNSFVYDENLALFTCLVILEAHQQADPRLLCFILEKCTNLQQLTADRCPPLQTPSIQAYKITHLTLTGSNYKVLPIEFCMLTELQYLCLNDNQLEGLPKQICNLTHLKRLELIRNHIKDLCDEFYGCTELTSINLSQNRLVRLSDKIARLKHLRVLRLWGNPLESLPENLQNLPLDKVEFSSQRLNISTPLAAFLMSKGVEFTEVSKTLDNDVDLSEAEYLHLSLTKSKITRAPVQPSFRIVHLSEVVMEEFADWLSQCDLIELTINYGQLKTVPESMQFPFLRYLDLSHNHLRELPDVIGLLAQLRVLNLSNNSISELPYNFQALKKLEILHLGSNRLKTVATIISLIALRELDLNNNQLDSLPDLSGLTNLERLLLSNNCLKHPKKLLFPKSLRVIDISHNDLKNIPASIFSLPNLTSLTAIQIEMVEVDESISHCKKLAILNLNTNGLRHLPACLGRFRHLREISIRGNPIENESATSIPRGCTVVCDPSQIMKITYTQPIKRATSYGQFPVGGGESVNGVE